MITEIAAAKVNIYLHVGPVRADGLHALESLFVFADAGDVVRAAPAREISLEIIGPFTSALSREPPEKNLIVRAARLLARAAGVRMGAHLVLEKRLPVASGIGGGSADAAAALRALVRLWGLKLTDRKLRELAFSLGADVPACLAARPVFVTGAGDRLAIGPRLPPVWICLANPNVPMLTGPIFRAFDLANPSPPAPARAKPVGSRYCDLVTLFQNSRNDLEPVAISRSPVIEVALKRLRRRPGVLAARMSGSGATVYGLFTSPAAAQRAAWDAAGQGWWSMSAGISCGVLPGVA